MEAIRVLMVAKRSARSERIKMINQARSQIVAGPDDLRARFAGHAVAALVAETALLRPRTGDVVVTALCSGFEATMTRLSAGSVHDGA